MVSVVFCIILYRNHNLLLQAGVGSRIFLEGIARKTFREDPWGSSEISGEFQTCSRVIGANKLEVVAKVQYAQPGRTSNAEFWPSLNKAARCELRMKTVTTIFTIIRTTITITISITTIIGCSRVCLRALTSLRPKRPISRPETLI